VTMKRRVSLGSKGRKKERKRTFTAGDEKRNPCFVDHESESRDEMERTVEEV
jgi:hypothetical protein